MTKERTPTSYLNDDWGMTPTGGDNASGVEGNTDGNDNSGNPMRWDLPPSPEWGWNEKEGKMTSYGHSDDVVQKQDYQCWDDCKKDDVAKGYTSPKSDGEGGTLETRQPYGSFPQNVPSTNEWDRGSGSDVRAKEFKNSEGRGFDGRGKSESTSNPGGESLGSSKLPA